LATITSGHQRRPSGGDTLQAQRAHPCTQPKTHRPPRKAGHKEGGKICYTRKKADRCNPPCQSDGATALMALGANITLESKGGQRTVDLANFYTTDGIMPFAMESHELLKEIIIPVHGAQSAYQKLAYRSAIDYPIVCAGVFLKLSSKNEIEEARIVVGAMGRSPLLLAHASSSLKGKKLNDTYAFKKAADDSMDSSATFAVHNVGATLEYRCAMVSQMVFQALEQAAKYIKG
ncbi:MAG: FAD binding domain-containing protein, partial [Deltaproteobacteria bacterium]|nr:FAD binding domain-containing protein [Candidatus Desulfobacula maris]